ncbi:MAG: 50S ribosome-binding GTPase [Candidatus Micrarchaeota archaeon]|nr:50S ribosome-binding GTPase [Candidatus Micrarchaeota archaeon]
MQKAILVDRINIGIYGRTNTGKSTIMNLLTNQNSSIVDDTPGTTSDIVRVLYEIHDFGPVRIFDTPGLDEYTQVGFKRKEKALLNFKECDLILLVINPNNKNLKVENEIMSLAKQYQKQLIIVFNWFKNQIQNDYDLNKNVEFILENLFDAKAHNHLIIDASEKESSRKLVEAIKQFYKKEEKKIDILPFVKPYSFVALNIPIDEETPERRLLRPQNVVLDYLLRRMVPFAGYRMDLQKARSQIKEIQEEEKNNYLAFIEELNGTSMGLQLVITDSQAIDIVDKWTPREIPITTFSITMINYQSNGHLKKFIEGLNVLKRLKKHDKVLIAEACNHDRKCDDIGTKQIPRRLTQKLGFELEFKFVFGREFFSKELLDDCKLIIHCGGCMVDSQKIQARILTAEENLIPITNYGLVLSYIEGEKALNRVLEPWLKQLG